MRIHMCQDKKSVSMKKFTINGSDNYSNFPLQFLAKQTIVLKANLQRWKHPSGVREFVHDSDAFSILENIKYRCCCSDEISTLDFLE